MSVYQNYQCAKRQLAVGIYVGLCLRDLEHGAAATR